MSGAVANVRNIMEIAGVDSASQAIDKVKRSMAGLGDMADKTSQKTQKVDPLNGLDANKLQQGTQRAGAAFSGPVPRSAGWRPLLVRPPNRSRRQASQRPRWAPRPRFCRVRSDWRRLPWLVLGPPPSCWSSI